MKLYTYLRREYSDEDTGSLSHHTTVSDSKMNGISFETSFYTRLTFIPPARKYFIEISVRQTIEHTTTSIGKCRVKHALCRIHGNVVFF